MSAQRSVPGAASPVPSLPNLRDLGGWPTVDGRAVRRGVLFRSQGLRGFGHDDGLSPEVLGVADVLGIGTVYDLRSDQERAAAPDPEWPGVAAVHLDVLADDSGSAVTGMRELGGGDDPMAALRDALADGSAVDAMTATYRGLVTLPSARRGYTRFVRGLLGADSGGFLFHCTAGKDRTGWAAAALLVLLGVSRDDVYDEYLLTNDRLLPTFASVLDAFAEAGGDPAQLTRVLGVQPAYLDAAFDEMERVHGDVAAYFADGLGVDAAAQDRLRELFLTR